MPTMGIYINITTVQDYVTLYDFNRVHGLSFHKIFTRIQDFIISYDFMRVKDYNTSDGLWASQRSG